MTTGIQWLDWVRRMQSIGQAGLKYGHDAYDLERYEQLIALAAEIAGAHTGVAAEKIAALYRHERGYPTPKVDVRGVAFNEAGELLLVREAKNGRWTLPGGWADVYDTPSQAVEREIREESGFEARATRLLAVYDRDNQGHPPFEFAVYKLYFLCEMIGGCAQTSLETSAVGFFSVENLPEIDEGRTLRAHLERFFVMAQDPTEPTDFD